MTSEHQVALARTQRMPAPSSHISKTARQVVPAFLQKLYEMVNDPNNAELIRWSDAGDSFFVLDHERFAHEVLGRWFKHRNFSSFVRQLNMYGFHKIPHLQQGVLKSDTETEFWNFAHANFHRGQPDLLCLIQRKKQPQQGDDVAIDLRDQSAGVGLLGAPVQNTGGVASTNPPVANAPLSSGQILDVNSIVNGIAAIKRHQTTISAELNELKRSNQILWQDAIAARERHQKQQDVINRIVKFLAGVFGNNSTSSGAGGVATGSPGPGTRGDDRVGENLGMARRKMRLMIEDAKRDGPKKSMVEELTELPLGDMEEYESTYPTIETPISAASPAASVAMSDRVTVTEAPTQYQPSTPSVDSASSTNDSRSTSSTSSKTAPTVPAQYDEQGKQISRSVTPARHSPPSFEFDPRIHGVLNQLTPGQIQQLLASLASQPPLSDPTLSTTSNASPSTINPSATNMSGLLTSYLQPSSFDFSINPSSQINNQPTFANLSHPVGSTDGLVPFDQYTPGPSAPNQNLDTSVSNPQQAHEERMQTQWQAAEDIDKDVNALNSSINSLIQTFGLDPSLLGEHTDMSNAGQDMDDDMHGTSGDGTTGVPDFDFDSFFNHLSSGSGVNGMEMATDSSGTNGVDYNDMVSTAFLDEVQTPSSDMTASPMPSLRQVSPELNLGAVANDVNVSSTGLRHATNEGSKLLNPNANANTTTAGRKRKSEIDFAALADAMEGQGSTSTATTTNKMAATPGGPAKSKRRKDK